MPAGFVLQDVEVSAYIFCMAVRGQLWIDNFIRIDNCNGFSSRKWNGSVALCSNRCCAIILEYESFHGNARQHRVGLIRDQRVSQCVVTRWRSSTSSRGSQQRPTIISLVSPETNDLILIGNCNGLAGITDEMKNIVVEFDPVNVISASTAKDTRMLMPAHAPAATELGIMVLLAHSAPVIFSHLIPASSGVSGMLNTIAVTFSVNSGMSVDDTGTVRGPIQFYDVMEVIGAQLES